MSVMDIRGNGVGRIDKIVFAEDYGYSTSSVIVLYEKGKTLKLEDSDGDCTQEVLLVDVPNLIKALQKAVELGWCPKPIVKKPAVAKKPIAVKK